MVLGGPGRHDEPLGDLRVREPLGQERQHLELRGRQAGRVRACRLSRPLGNAHPELAHAPGRACVSGSAPSPARDLDRLDERLLVVEQRQHQGPVVRPADLAEGVGRRPRQSRRAWRRAAPMRLPELDVDPGDGGPRRDRTAKPAWPAGTSPASLSNRSVGIGAPVVRAHSVASSRTGTIRCSSPVRSA